MKIIETAKELADIASGVWELIPERLQIHLHKHFDAINVFSSEIKIYPDLMPENWINNEKLLTAYTNYLVFLKKQGMLITFEKQRALINIIHVKTKDDVDLASESYLFSTAKEYTAPFVPSQEQVLLMGIAQLPSAQNVKAVFQHYFKNQEISDNLINLFLSFNLWSKDNMKFVFASKSLQKFVKELSILTEKQPGKVFTTLKYLGTTKSIELPLDYSIILTYIKNQNDKSASDNAKD